MTGPLLGDKAASVVFDNSKIKRYVPSFRADIPFKVGIRRTLAWFEADPKRYNIREETHRLIDGIIGRYEKAF